LSDQSKHRRRWLHKRTAGTLGYFGVRRQAVEQSSQSFKSWPEESRKLLALFETSLFNNIIGEVDVVVIEN